MHSPFSDFIEVAPERLTGNADGLEIKSPLLDYVETYSPVNIGEGENEDVLAENYLTEQELTNKHKINVKKAISANQYYEKKTWGKEKEKIYKVLAFRQVIEAGQQLSDEHFSYAIADFQAKKGLAADGILGPLTYALIQTDFVTSLIPAPVKLVRSPWHKVFPDAVQCPVEVYANGNDAFWEMARVIKTATQQGHFIYLLSGWVAEVDFCLSPNPDKNLAGIDTSSSLGNLLKQAANNGVDIKILSWNNPKSLKELDSCEKFIKGLNKPNAIMARDNFTYGTEFMKGLMSKIQSAMTVLSAAAPVLNTLDFWNEKRKQANAFPNQGSHHEKILVVKGSEGLIAFCGGMDLNANRIMGLKGFCCGDYLNPASNCDLEKDSSGNWRSQILHDTHCKLTGKGAELLLERFRKRWQLHYSQYNLPAPAVAGTGSNAGPAITADTPYIKLLHTFNHPRLASDRDRSILNTVERVIKNAKTSIVMECQYMISPEIATWLNSALKASNTLKVDLYTQDDEFASELMFVHFFRRRFRDILFGGLNSSQKARINLHMLDPHSNPPIRRRVHSKAYIIDDELAIIGSANCNRRSMTFDSETAVAIFQDGDPSRSIVKKLSEKIRNDQFNKWIPYAENFTRPAMDFDTKILTSPYFGISVGIAQIPMGGIAPFTAHQGLAALSRLIREIVDPHPDGEPNIIKEIEEEFDETVIQEMEAIAQSGALTEQIKTESEIAGAIEHQVAVVSKPCNDHTCWAKSVLNSLSNLNLPVNKTLDEQAKNAIGAFQQSNGLPQTRIIDAATERALLEADAIRRSRGTAAEAAAIKVISTAKTKIEDWTLQGKSGVKTKPKFILESYRDPRTLWAFVLHHMAFKRRGRVSKAYSDPEAYVNTGSHFCIMMDGRIIQLHPFSRMIWHGNCLSPRSVAVEFEGNFPDIKGRWWFDRKKYKRSPDEDRPTQAQYEAGRFLASYLKVVLNTRSIHPHRQSSKDRTNDPGPDIWYNVGEWAIKNLGLSDGGPDFKCGDGNPVLPAWRTWGEKAGLQPEFSGEGFVDTEEYEESLEEIEMANLLDDESSFAEFTEPENEDLTADYEQALVDEYDQLIAAEEEAQAMFEAETNWSKAISSNRKYAATLGWNSYYDRINNLLLPYSGMQNVSLGEEAFAQAVAAWQAQQGLSADGIIGPNTWGRMKVLIVPVTPSIPLSPSAPSMQNVFEFNRWHAQKIIDTMNAGIIGTYFNSKDQLEKITRGETVLNVNPHTKIVYVLPVMYHIAELARQNNYTDIFFGSFIRAASTDGKCTGHCAGRCIDINFKERSFETEGALRMVNNILTYLLSMPSMYKQNLGFGLPLQKGFFGSQKLTKFHFVSHTYLQDGDMQSLIVQLGRVFPDNPNHLHIQANYRG